MKLNQYLNTLLILLLGGITFYNYSKTPKLAYIQSNTLVNEFKGMKEARMRYQQQEQQWQANLDTLQADYQRRASQEPSDSKLPALRQNIQQYAHLEQYGKDNGYDLLLGTTDGGNVLYGTPALDITQEVLDALNETYQPTRYETN